MECVDSTDDTSILTRCLEMLKAAEKRREEGDEIVTEMAIASQLRQSGTDKQQLMNHALNSLETNEAEEEPVADTEQQEPAHAVIPWRRILFGCIIVIVVGALITLFYRHINMNADDQDRPHVTVAEHYETITVNGCSFNMVSIEGGTFTMGATITDGEEDGDELPVQQVTLSNYTIGETEVTQGLWRAVMGNLPATFDGDNHPMKDVSWEDCQQFIAKLNELTGRHFHLPTEAQWEYAARGGKQSKNYKYAGSNDIFAVAWHAANTWDQGKDSPAFGNHAVGTLQANELGLYDMSGNVWEWCQDSYARYDGTPKTNPSGPANAKNAYRVNRGGSWDYIASSARISNRRNRTVDFRNFNLGLRLAE